MYLKTPVRIPYESKKIVQTKSANGEIYIGYTIATPYSPTDKRTHPVRKGIGKMVQGDNTMMYPNENYYRLFPDEVMPEESLDGRSRCLKSGAFLVLQKLLHECHLDEILTDVLGDSAGFALDLAMYDIVSDSNVMQYYTNYAKTHPVLTKGQKMYSDSTISNYLNLLGREFKNVDFLNEWTAKRPKNGRIYISYDSTNKRCESGNITYAEHGHAKKGEGEGKIVNLSLAYDHVNKEPVFYEMYSGSIVDVSQLKTSLNKAKSYGFDNVGVILDRGYFSKDNLEFMDKNNIPYIIMVKGLMPWVHDLVNSHMGEFEHDGSHRIEEKGVNGATYFEQVSHVTASERYCHLYYSAELDISETKQLDKKFHDLDCSLEKLKRRGAGKAFKTDIFTKWYTLEVETLPGGKTILWSYKRKDKAIDEMYKLCGYFVIISTENMSAKQALITYKNRDEVEKLFRANKRFAPCERVASDDSLRGKLLIEFIAMIIYSKFVAKLEEECIKNHKHPNYFTAPAAIQELEKITMIADSKHVYQLETALSKAQKEILAAFDITYDSVRRHCEQISQILCKQKEGELLAISAKWHRKKRQNPPSYTT